MELLEEKSIPRASNRTVGQFNLFTGEVEPPKDEAERVPEERWLFDPDFGLVLPEDPSGKEITVAEGVTLQFPLGHRPQITGNRSRRMADTIENSESQIEYSTKPLIFGKRPFVPETPRVARTPDGAQLILSGYGIYLGKKSERLQVKIAGKVAKSVDGSAYEFPFFRLSEVVIASRGVSLSSDLIESLCEQGVRLSFLDSGGRPYALISSPALTATVESRREQLMAFNDARGFEFARAVVRGKVRNQRHLLLYCGKYLKSADAQRYAAIEALARQLRQIELQLRRASGNTVSEKRHELMGLEGTAGRLYWEGFRTILGEKVEFMGRAHRGASDGANSLLNYGYGILYSHVWGAVANAGLEPFAGFLHVDCPGKPSLVLDLVEEFRQPVVDRTVIAFINLGQAVGTKEGMLDEETRRVFAGKVLERLASAEKYRGREFQIRSIIQMQARSLVSFLRGKAPYRPFSFRW